MAAASDDRFATLHLDRQLCFSLYALTNRMLALYRPLLAAVGLTYPQMLVMMSLWERDRQGLSEIGARLMLDSGTLSPLLKRLESAGLVRRTRRRRDERTLEISLTAEGHALRERLLSVRSRVMVSLGLANDQIERIRQDLDELMSHAVAAETGDIDASIAERSVA